MKTKLKLKPKVKLIILLLFVFIIISVYGYNAYQDYLYEQTYEYKIMQLGYTFDEYKMLKENFKEKYLEKFINMGYNENILLLLKEKYYIKDNFEKYLDYISKEDVTINEAITTINLGLNEEYYKNPSDTDIEKESLMLVNKYTKLSEDYIPKNLVSVSRTYSWGEEGSIQVIDYVYEAFLEMAKAAKEEGHSLMINSAYRSYISQKEVYETYEKSYGKDYADSIAARPGFSEHQSGYSLDIFSLASSSQTTFKDSDTYNWLINNCYKFGFILRYPESKENITGFNFESWHYRFVGSEAATFISNNNLTFDEYYAFYLR